MPIPEFTFDPKGDPLRVKIDFRSPHIVSYELWLWENASNTLAMDRVGNNRNPQDDEYDLPTPPSVNRGRSLECTLTIADPEEGSSHYKVAMVVSQTAKTPLEVVAEGDYSGQSVVRSLFANLVST